ncbi:MAG: hypothetical protein ACM3X4_06440 [Ignavibacteriales bacterium]
MEVIQVFKRKDGTIVERVSENELTALAIRYAAALLREIEESMGTVTIRLQEEGNRRLAVGEADDAW